MRTPMPMSKNWQDIRSRLEARRTALNAEIAAYPPPIPACDAQFNHLLEQQSALRRELRRLDAAQAAGAGPEALARFIASCPFLAGKRGDRRQ